MSHWLILAGALLVAYGLGRLYHAWLEADELTRRVRVVIPPARPNEFGAVLGLLALGCAHCGSRRWRLAERAALRALQAHRQGFRGLRLFWLLALRWHLLRLMRNRREEATWTN